MACILLWSSAVRVHDSQAYRKMDVTRERISRILELREILLSIQTGFSLVNACCCLCYPREYVRLGTLISYNRAQDGSLRQPQALFWPCFCPLLMSFQQGLDVMVRTLSTGDSISFLPPQQDHTYLPLQERKKK